MMLNKKEALEYLGSALSSLVELDEGSCLPNNQTNLV